MDLKINQEVILKLDGEIIEGFVRRINRKTITIHQRKPKLQNGGVYTYRIPIRYWKKYLSQE
jgi:hypothetical protein